MSYVESMEDSQTLWSIQKAAPALDDASTTTTPFKLFNQPTSNGGTSTAIKKSKKKKHKEKFEKSSNGVGYSLGLTRGFQLWRTLSSIRHSIARVSDPLSKVQRRSLRRRLTYHVDDLERIVVGVNPRDPYCSSEDEAVSGDEELRDEVNALIEDALDEAALQGKVVQTDYFETRISSLEQQCTTLKKQWEDISSKNQANTKKKDTSELQNQVENAVGLGVNNVIQRGISSMKLSSLSAIGKPNPELKQTTVSGSMEVGQGQCDVNKIKLSEEVVKKQGARKQVTQRKLVLVKNHSTQNRLIHTQDEAKTDHSTQEVKQEATYVQIIPQQVAAKHDASTDCAQVKIEDQCGDLLVGTKQSVEENHKNSIFEKSPVNQQCTIVDWSDRMQEQTDNNDFQEPPQLSGPFNQQQIKEIICGRDVQLDPTQPEEITICNEIHVERGQKLLEVHTEEPEVKSQEEEIHLEHEELIEQQPIEGEIEQSFENDLGQNEFRLHIPLKKKVGRPPKRKYQAKLNVQAIESKVKNKFVAIESNDDFNNGHVQSDQSTLDRETEAPKRRPAIFPIATDNIRINTRRSRNYSGLTVLTPAERKFICS